MVDTNIISSKLFTIYLHKGFVNNFKLKVTCVPCLIEYFYSDKNLIQEKLKLNFNLLSNQMFQIANSFSRFVILLLINNGEYQSNL